MRERGSDTEWFTARDGHRVAFRLIGEGSDPPAVVIGGGPCRGTAYLEDLGSLAGTRRLAVLHARGTDPTDGLPRGWWRDADDVADLIGHLGLTAADLVTHSAGARMALATVARYPGLVASLALVTPAAGWLVDVPNDGREVAESRRHEPDIARALEAFDWPAPASQEEFDRQRAATAPAAYVTWGERQQTHSRLGEMRVEALQAYQEEVPEDAVTRVLEAGRVPTLVVAAAGDTLTGPQQVRAAAELLGGSFTQIEDSGHYPWVDQPEQLVAVLGRWLSRAA